MLREQTSSERTEALYSKLGELLDTIARKRNVRGPYSVAKRVTDTNGSQISGQGVSRLFYGENYPRPSFIAAFAQAFELSIEERDRLAWLYTYGEELEDETQSILKGYERFEEGT
jgi:hypothetical protein